MFTFVLIQKVISQSTISVTNMDGDLNSSVSNPPEFDASCHIHTILLTLPAATDSLFNVSNAQVSYTMTSDGSAKMKQQRSKIFFVNTFTEEDSWVSGIGEASGTFNYSRTIDLANGVYIGGSVLKFQMWAVRTKASGSPGCDQLVTRVDASSWTIEIEYSSVAIDTGAVGIGTLTPDPSAKLDIQSAQKGFLPPRMSEPLMNYIQTPADGLIVHCTDCEPTGMYTAIGGIWVPVGSGGSDIFTKTGNNIHQKSAEFNESFLIGRNALPDASLINDTFMFFNQPKAAFRGGLLTNELKPWQPDSLGVGSFAYGENLYAPSFGEVALGLNNEFYTPLGTNSFNDTDRIFSIGIGNGIMDEPFGIGKKMKNAITVLKNGNVGISTTAPSTKLDISGSMTVRNRLYFVDDNNATNMELNKFGHLHFYNDVGDNAVSIFGNVAPGVGPLVIMKNYTGTNTILFDGGLANGKGKITTDIIEIKGGSDFAEYFEINENTEKIKPGLVVCIDQNNSGELKLSQQKYDRKVIGVISGANGVDAGMVMGQKGTVAFGDHAVALIGRVYVKCNDENGKIKAGDFLTTSSTSGEAMRVKKFRKSQGSIIGKALSGMDPKSGFVLVFVNLQ